MWFYASIQLKTSDSPSFFLGKKIKMIFKRIYLRYEINQEAAISIIQLDFMVKMKIIGWVRVFGFGALLLNLSNIFLKEWTLLNQFWYFKYISEFRTWVFLAIQNLIFGLIISLIVYFVCLHSPRSLFFFWPKFFFIYFRAVHGLWVELGSSNDIWHNCFGFSFEETEQFLSVALVNID